MKVTAAAILVGVMILGGCAEGKRKMGAQKYKDNGMYPYGQTFLKPKNIKAALVGIDLPTFRPYGTSTTVSAQPGIRYQIFEEDSTAVTHRGNGECEITEETDYLRTFEEDVNSMETFSSKHSGIQIGYKTDISFTAAFESGSDGKLVKNKASASTTSSMTIPPLYTGSDTTETSMSELKQQFVDQSGSKTLSYTKCLKYTVNIHKNDHLNFSQNFLEAIRKIESSDTIFEEDAAARKLLDHYGTHYAQEVHMGSTLTIEKTFDQKLEAMYSKEGIDKCVDSSENWAGQHWKDSTECEDLWNSLNSENEVQKETSTIWSIGCMPQKSAEEWMSNLSTDTTAPAPIEWHNFLPISELMELKGITDNLDDDSKGLKKVRDAIWRAYDDYCKTHRVDDTAAEQKTGARCELGCPKDVYFKDENEDQAKLVQHDNLTVHNGRVLYKEDGEDNWLFYSRGHWYLGPDIGESDTAKYESMVCPLTGYKMLNPVFVTVDGSNVNSNDLDEWTECSNKCAGLKECNHWQYDQENQKCLLVESFSGFKAVEKSVISSIETKTSTIENSETNNVIKVSITCGSKTCSATLDDAEHTSKDLFKKGATDTFTGDMIGACNAFECNTELKTKIIHQGDDGWHPEYIRIKFTDGTACTSTVNTWIKESEGTGTFVAGAQCDPPLITDQPSKIAAGHRNCNPRGPTPTLFNMCPDTNEVTFMWRNKNKEAFYDPTIGLGAPVNCKWGAFNEFGSCSSLNTTYPPCYQVRTRKKTQEARNGGTVCEDSAIEKKVCTNQICDMKTVTSCENTVVRLKCDDTAEAIKIHKVFYGSATGSSAPACVKKGTDDCDAGAYAKMWVQFQWNEDENTDGKKVFYGRQVFATGAGCEGANFCKFDVNKELVSHNNDFCESYHKFVKVEYKCERSATRHNKRVSEYADVKAECPVGEVISVQHPVIFKSYYCNENPLEQGKAYEALNQECEGKQSCDFKPRVVTGDKDKYTNTHFADVCGKKEKELTFNYKCGTSVLKCEGGTVNLECPTGRVIVIKDAFWGRGGRTPCRDHSGIYKMADIKTDCGVSDSDRHYIRGLVQYRCDGKRECELEAKNDFLNGHRHDGDPCNGVRKYLKVEYGCMEGFKTEPEAARIQIKDGSKMTLRCPNEDEKIKINWPVVYESEHCPDKPLHRPDAYQGISEECEGKNECDFVVGPTLPHFENVCIGEKPSEKPTKLTVYWRCVI